MPQSRAIAVLGLTLLFAVLTSLLFLNPALGPFLFLGYAFLFMFSDFVEEYEIPLIFAFLVLLVALVLMRQIDAAGARVAILVQTVGIYTLAYGGFGTYRKRLNKAQYHAQVEMTEVDQEIRELERDTRFYEKFKQNMEGQVRLRQDFSEAAQALSNTMDLQEIRTRLMGILSKNFPDAHIEILSGVPKDPLEAWTAQQRLPVLVPDLKSDERFRTFHMSYPFRSVMVVPMRALHQPVGFLRIEHEEENTFQPADLRTAELYSTMASLAMENVRLYEQIQELAVRDGLTQLYTHRHFQGRLAEEILQAGRSRTALSVVLSDIDHFKKYNDGYGHQAGDALLRRIAAILQESIRDIDYVARYGGEEFVLILPSLPKADAAKVAELIRKRVEAEKFNFNNAITTVTMSFGVASFPEDATTQSQLIRFADERLYKSKHGGRNRVTTA